MHWQFLTEKIYQESVFQIFLMIMHLSFLMIFLFCKWTNWKQFLKEIRLSPMTHGFNMPHPFNTVAILFICNYIGIIFSIGSHRQFYIWYSFTIPFLINSLRQFPLYSKFIIFFCFEYGYWCRPPTW
jgi:alpha-1,3-mannosyltransferase